MVPSNHVERHLEVGARVDLGHDCTCSGNRWDMWLWITRPLSIYVLVNMIMNPMITYNTITTKQSKPNCIYAYGKRYGQKIILSGVCMVAPWTLLSGYQHDICKYMPISMNWSTNRATINKNTKTSSNNDVMTWRRLPHNRSFLIKIPLTPVIPLKWSQ